MLRPPARGGAGKRRLTAFFALFLGGTAWGTDYIWTSDPVVIGTDTAWTNSLNWTPSAPPVLPAIFPAGDTLEIASLGPNDPIITGDLAVDSLTVTAGTLDMNGQNLTVTTAAVNGGTITGTGTLTVASSLELNAPLDLTMITATVDISAAAVTVNSPATLTAGTQTADSLTVNGPATVSGNLTVDSFTVASAAATVSGTLTVTTSLGLSSGEIAGTGTVSFGGGTVTTPSATTAAISGGAIDTTGLTLNAGSKPMAITSTGGNILLPLGTITAGDIGLTASGTGSLTSGYTLNQVTNNGSLTLAADLDAGAITNTGTLNLNGSDITGLSGFTNTGGTVNFTGPETITGVTTLAGTVNFNGNSTNLGGISGFGALNLNAGTHALSTAISATAVTINSSATLTLGGSPTAIATLTNNGTLNLNGSDITGLSGFTNNNILNSDGGELIAGITSIGGTVNLAGDFPVSGGTA
ncbi:MAG: hypothetical protein LBD37_02505, partial [Treponema sp.]|nr:hypothetical protein [Treponema sp.]